MHKTVCPFFKRICRQRTSQWCKWRTTHYFWRPGTCLTLPISASLDRVEEYHGVREKTGLQLIISNSLGQLDCIAREMSLFSYINFKDLLTMNIGNAPTFINSRRREGFVMTIANRSALGLVSDWQVRLEHSFTARLKQLVFL